MKRAVLGLVIWLVAASALAFEGTMNVVATSAGNNMTINVFSAERGDVRLDMTMRDPKGKVFTTAIINPATGNKRYMMDHERKVVTVMAKQAGPGTKKAKPGDYKIEKLGNEKMEGYDTQHVRFTNVKTGDVMEAWITPKYPPTLLSRAFGKDTASQHVNMEEVIDAMRAADVEPGLPIRVFVPSSGKNKNEMDMRIKSIKPGKLAANTFAVPSAGYETRDVTEMQKNMPKAEDFMKDGKVDMKKIEELKKQYGVQ